MGSQSDIITSSSTYDDGNWRLLDTSYSDGIQSLSIDGVLIGTQSEPETGYAGSYTYVLGTGYTGGWTGGNGNNFDFDGAIAQAAIYPTALSANQIALHYGATQGTSFIQTVTYTSTTTPTVTVTDGGTYNGQAFNAVGRAVGVDGLTPVAGSFNYEYFASDGVTPLGGAPTNAGSYYVTATFTSSDPNYGNATSAETSFTIGKASSTVTLSSSVNPSVYAQSVTFSVSVASTTSLTPTGTVAFYSGTTFLGRSPLNASGQATFTTTSLAVGTDTVRAVYDDATDSDATLNTNFQTSSNTIVETVNADVTNQVTVSRSGLVANRRTGSDAGTIGITNTSQAAFSGGLIFDWTGLAAGVSVQSVSVVINGVTTALTVTSDGKGGSQVVISSSLLAQLLVGQTITLNVIYSDPTFTSVNFLPDLLSNPTL